MQDGFPTSDYLAYVQCPVHLIHGTDDEKIYYESTVKLKQCCTDLGKKDVRQWKIDGGKHNIRPSARFLKALSEILE